MLGSGNYLGDVNEKLMSEECMCGECEECRERMGAKNYWETQQELERGGN